MASHHDYHSHKSQVSKLAPVKSFPSLHLTSFCVTWLGSARDIQINDSLGFYPRGPRKWKQKVNAPIIIWSLFAFPERNCINFIKFFSFSKEY